MAIQTAQIVTFLKDNIEPLEHAVWGKQYRASVRLLDNVYLPCVLFQGRATRVDKAISRFSETAKEEDAYRSVVASFVTSDSTLAEWEIKEVAPSPSAWPVALLKRIQGETTMGWTAFVVQMKDGSFHSYGTSFSLEFFDLPAGYSYDDIVNIQSDVAYTPEKRAVPFNLFRLCDLEAMKVYRERPFFTRFLDGLV